MKKILTTILIVALLGFANQAFAAIGFVSAANEYFGTPATSHTKSFEVTEATNGFLVVSITTNNASPQDAVSSVIWDSSQSMTSVAEYQTTNQNVRMYYYVLYAPNTGTNDLVVNLTDSLDVDIHIAYYSGVNQANEIDSSNTGTATGNLTLTTTTVADNAWLLSMARNSSAGPMTAGTGTTDRSSGTRIHASGDSNGAKTPAGSHSMQWTAASGDSFGLIISLAPAEEVGSTSGGAAMLSAMEF